MKVSGLKAKLGVALLSAVFSLNAIHAFNDYGVAENRLHNEILAQRNGSTGGGSGGSSVSCSCGFAWGKGCKADNHGSTCATVEECWKYDKNCSN